MNDRHSDLPIVDGHVDILYEMIRHHPDTPFHEISTGPVTLKKLEKGGIRIIVTALYCPDEHNGPGSAAEYLEGLFDMADKYLAGLNHILTAKEIDSCFKGETGIGKILLLENSDALLEMGTDKLEESGLKVVGLTHAGRNRIGDGNGIRYPEGLTSEGKALVKILDNNGFAIDLAHLSQPCFWEVIDTFKGPVISSHTGISPLCDIPRNLSPEQVEIMLQRDGLIGITINPEMLSEDQIADAEDVFKHIDFIAQKYGVDGIALGSDLCGFDMVTSGAEDISKLKNLVEILERHGYPREAVQKIMGENWRLFYSSLLS